MNTDATAVRAQPSESEVAAQVRLEAAKILKVSPGELHPETSWIDDLEADSLDLTELASVLEDKFGIRIDDADLVPLSTVQEACDFIWKRLNAD